MRLPRVRFTVGRMMVVVAVVALASGGVAWQGRMRRLSAEYEWRYLEYAEIYSGPWPRRRSPRPLSDRERWRVEMRDKYSRASLYPWLPVAPDPPYPRGAGLVDDKRLFYSSIGILCRAFPGTRGHARGRRRSRVIRG